MDDWAPQSSYLNSSGRHLCRCGPGFGANCTGHALIYGSQAEQLRHRIQRPGHSGLGMRASFPSRETEVNRCYVSEKTCFRFDARLPTGPSRGFEKWDCMLIGNRQ